jgi:hypothetical protein
MPSVTESLSTCNSFGESYWYAGGQESGFLGGLLWPADHPQRGRKNGPTAIYLLGRATHNASDLVTDICRCERIAEQHRNDPDQETREYCASQTERAGNLIGELRKGLGRQLVAGLLPVPRSRHSGGQPGP